ncbi:MAG TPA: lipopolysaccharide biosynthesis protein [Thermoanaerobaculia bacterium]|nr:lipopolysaccharide biosynthesis protein [Thermoanaerobaculia bacterium]
MISRIKSLAARSPLARNTVANALGQLAAPLLALALVPFYLATLGLEGYGLLVFFATMSAALMVFSSGIGWALQREIAHRNTSPEERETLPALVRTFEVLYWAAAVLVALAIFVFAPVIAERWLQTTLPADDAVVALRTAGLRIGLAFPMAIYHVVLLALQRQVRLNSILSIAAVFSAAACAVAVATTRSVVGFAVADTLMALVTVVALSRIARLPSATARFRRAELSRLWRMSLSLVWIHGVGVVIKQLDRIIMSKLLPLASLGVYSAGTAGGRILPMVYGPFSAAVYPQTCAIARQGDDDRFAAHVMRNAAVFFVLGLGAALPLAFFAGDLLLAWTRNTSIASGGARAMAVFVAGSLCTAATTVLQLSQTAKGITGPAVRVNTMAILWFPLVLWWLVGRFGIVGAAWAWLLYGATSWSYYLLTTPTLARTGARATYLRTHLAIVAATIPVAAAMRWLSMEFFEQSLWLRVACAIATGALVLGAGALTAFGRHLGPGIDLFRQSMRGASDP